jgi:hypothetical protein
MHEDEENEKCIQNISRFITKKKIIGRSKNS